MDPSSGEPKAKPTEDEIKTLLKDAFSVNPSRYGNVSKISGDTVNTDTGVEVNVDWNSLSLVQKGKDTDRIDLLYRVHYLQWTGVPVIDKVLGMIGILLVVVLTALGAKLAIKGRS